MSIFVSFEGGERTGKSTQARALHRQISRLGLPVVLLKEPGSTALGAVVRRLLKHRLSIDIAPLPELLLFAVSRSQLVAEVIRPALERGAIVVCDRYAESTLAYQGYGRGLDLKTIADINTIATGGARPHLIVFLDLAPEDAFRRQAARAQADRFELEDLAFHRRVRQGYLDMAAADPERWFIVDAAQPRAKVQKLIWERVRQIIPGMRPPGLSDLAAR